MEARRQIEAEAGEIELSEIHPEQDNNGALTNNASYRLTAVSRGKQEEDQKEQ